jgi:hypothetical protein
MGSWLPQLVGIVLKAAICVATMPIFFDPGAVTSNEKNQRSGIRKIDQ